MAQLKDLLVSGPSRLIGKLFANEVQLTTLNIPTASNGTTYGPGTSGQVLVTNGTSAYWKSLTTGDVGSGTLPVNRGGTGNTVATQGGVVYGNGTTYALTAAGSSGQVLTSNGTSAPSWRSVLNNTSAGALGWNSAGASNTDNLRLVNVNTIAYWNGAYSGTSSNLKVLGTVTTGTWNASTIGVAYGGTGKTSWTKYGVVYASETNALNNTIAGTAGYLLKSGGGTAAPDWIAQSSITAGYASKLTALATSDQASSTDTWRYVWFSYNDNSTGRPAYTSTFAYQSSTGTLKATKFSGDGSGLTSLSAANISTGTLPVARGGTNATSVNKYGVVFGNANSNGYESTVAGTAGYLLQSGGGTNAPSWVNATNANTASAVVKRDASGNFSAGTITATLSGNATSSTWTTLIKPIETTTTASASTWNIPSGSKQVWGERFSDSTLTYTPSGGSATTITDTGDWVMWLTPNATSNAATLNMRIDGTYYGAFSGNLSGTATNATTATKLGSSNVGAADRPIYLAAGTATQTTYRMTGTNVTATTALAITNNLDTGIWYVNGTNSTDLYSQADGVAYVNKYNDSWIGEIYQDYRTGQIALRGKNNGTWQAWRKVLDSSNYTNWTVTKTGTGASGTWGINITGTASGVAQTNTTSDAEYRVLFSGTADDTTRSETTRKNTDLKYNPSTGTITTKTYKITTNATITYNTSNGCVEIIC